VVEHQPGHRRSFEYEYRSAEYEYEKIRDRSTRPCGHALAENLDLTPWNRGKPSTVL